MSSKFRKDKLGQLNSELDGFGRIRLRDFLESLFHLWDLSIHHVADDLADFSGRLVRRSLYSPTGFCTFSHLIPSTLEAQQQIYEVRISTHVLNASLADFYVSISIVTAEYLCVGTGPLEGDVLIVNDDEDICISLKDFLTDLGVDVATAGDGHEAFAKLESGFRPRLILLDIQMPLMDGFALAQAIKKDSRFSDIPILAMSCSTKTELSAISSFVRELIPLPIDANELEIIISRYCVRKDVVDSPA